MAFGLLQVVRFSLRAPAAVATGALLLLTLSGPVVALAAASSATPSPSPNAQPPAGLEPAQEITLESLGIGSQTVQGGSGSVEVFLPPPAGPLAAAGSFVRVFFGHSPLLDASASSLTVAVNGQPLTSVRLEGSSADGSVFEARVTGSVLHADRPNLLQARFELKFAGVPATGDSAAYARIEPQTFLHYQLYGPPGSRPPPRLESYPFPFASRAGDSGVGFVLPRPAAEADLRAALRLAADLGRRTPAQQLQLEVVTAGSGEWLRSAGKPAVLVGTIGRLALAERALQAAGFSGSASGWSTPDGQQLRPSDGVLVAVTSPFDGQSPLLLVTGFTDDGLAKAAEALAGATGPPAAGSYAVLRGGVRGTPAPAADAWPRPGAVLALDDLGSDSAATGGGSRYLVLPFVAPAVDRGRSGSVEVRTRGMSPAVLLNGQPLPGAPPSQPSTAPESTQRLPFAGSLLRPGLNVLSLRFPAGGGSAVSVLGGSLTLPPTPAATAALEMLPEPVLSDPGGLLVTLARLDDGVLSAAARAFAALGSRGGVVRSLRVTEASAFDSRSLGRASLIAVGGSGGSQPLDRLRRQLTAAGDRTAGGAAGAAALVAEQALPGLPATPQDLHFQLWIEGSSSTLLEAGASTLYRHPLPGNAFSLDSAGRLQSLPAAAAPRERSPEQPAPLLRLLLPSLAVMAVAAILLGLGWQLRRPLEQAW